MLTTTLRSLWSHKLRLVATCIAVVLGVAFMAATLVLNSTLTRVFEDLFSDLGEGIDAVVRGPELFETDFGDPVRDLLPDTVVDKGEYAAAYSGFEGADAAGTALDDWLRTRGATEVDVCGIATDYCVKATALDSARAGFPTRVLLDLTAAVAPGNVPDVVAALRAAGVRVDETP